MEPPPVPPDRDQRGQRFERWMSVRRKGDFDRAHRTGSRSRGKDLIVIAVPNGRLRESRLGLAIGKRIAKRAVDRNRLRRRIREAFRLEYPALPEGVDLVVLGARPGADPDLAEVRQELVRLGCRATEKARAKATGGTGARGSR